MLGRTWPGSAIDGSHRKRMDVTKRLRLIRERLGLSTLIFSEKVGVPEQQLIRWESGSVEPTRDEIAAVAEQLGVRTDDILLLPLELLVPDEVAIDPSLSPGHRLQFCSRAALARDFRWLREQVGSGSGPPAYGRFPWTDVPTERRGDFARLVVLARTQGRITTSRAHELLRGGFGRDFGELEAFFGIR